MWDAVYSLVNMTKNYIRVEQLINTPNETVNNKIALASVKIGWKSRDSSQTQIIKSV